MPKPRRLSLYFDQPRCALFFYEKDAIVLRRRLKIGDVVNFYKLDDIKSGRLTLANEEIASARSFRELFSRFNTREPDGYRWGHTRAELRNGIKYTTDNIEDIIQAEDLYTLFDFCRPIFSSFDLDTDECREKILQTPNDTLAFFKDASGEFQCEVFVMPPIERSDQPTVTRVTVYSELGIPWLFHDEINEDFVPPKSAMQTKLSFDDCKF